MAVITTAYVVGTTPVQLGTATSRRWTLEIGAPSAGTVYLGGLNVTSATGRAHAAGAQPYIAFREVHQDPAPTQAWYAVVASGTATVRVLEITE